jgi:hypothetical protein
MFAHKHLVRGLAWVLLLFSALNCSEDPIEPTNDPPNVPANPSPAHGALFVPIDAQLRWTTSDPDNEAVTSDVFLDASSPPATMVASNITESTFDPTLNLQTTYHWQVVLRDGHANERRGPVWSFTTAPPDVHISYFDQTNGDLKYAVKSNGAWTTGAVDAVGSIPTSTSLALDSSGDPHIGYRSGDLKYAVKSAGQWMAEAVDASGGLHISLVLDIQNNPRMSYVDAVNGDLSYAAKEGGIWSIEVVNLTLNGFASTSLAVDAQGNPHIAYHEFPRRVVYSVKNGGWSDELIETTLGGNWTSLTLDTQGAPHIIYQYHDAKDVAYTRQEGAFWSREVVEAAGDVGEYTSIAIDVLGHPRVSYYDATNGNLKYAVKSGTSWDVETVDAAGDVGKYTSIAVDAQGNPHVSYYDATNGNLKYAVKLGATWVIEIVDTVGDVGMSTSLAVDG